MSEKLQGILDQVKGLTLLEAAQLVKMMEEAFGVSAAAAAVAAPAATSNAPAPVVEEQTEFNVVLATIGANKINVIKVVREITSLGLKEAVSKDEAESIKKKLTEAGATVEIK